MRVRKFFVLLTGAGLLMTVGLLAIPGIVNADDYQKMLKQNQQQAADLFRSQLTPPPPEPKTPAPLPQNQAQVAAPSTSSASVAPPPPMTDAQKAFAAPNLQTQAQQQPAAANNPWLKPNPWANQSYPPPAGTIVPPGQSPQQAQQGQSALPQPPNIFASPQAPSSTTSPSKPAADASKSAAPTGNQTP